MNKQSLLKSFQDLKKEIEGLKKNQALHGIVSKFNAEKKSLEKRIEKTVHAEIKKAKTFLDEQKKELNGLQKKVETMLHKKTKKTTKKVAAKTTKKVATRTTTTKKVSKKA
jgi:hypothetical protein